MELVYGALAVLTVVFVLEHLPVYLSERVEFALLLGASALAAVCVYDAFDRWSVLGAFAIAGLAYSARTAFRLLRAWADRIESINILQMGRRGR